MHKILATVASVSSSKLLADIVKMVCVTTRHSAALPALLPTDCPQYEEGGRGMKKDFLHSRYKLLPLLSCIQILRMTSHIQQQNVNLTQNRDDE